MDETVLKILRLPSGLSNEKRDELFKMYGAVRTKTVRKSDKYTITFAEFPSKEIANQVFIGLHQLEVKGKRLLIEFAKKKTIASDVGGKVELESEVNEEEDCENIAASNFKVFKEKLNSWAGGLNFSQPPPPDLCYKYPPPTRNTLKRIAVQLVKEPAFYTQVLHLMNRMNLPPPFIEMESEFPLLKETYDMEQYEYIFGPEIRTTEPYNEEEEEEKEVEEEESELESEEELTTIPLNIPQKRKLSQPKKLMKIPKFINPNQHLVPKTSVQKVVKPEEVFESVPKEMKNLKFNLNTVDKLLEQSSKQEESVSNVESERNPDSGFGLIFPANRSEEQSKTEEKEAVSKPEFISSEQLEENRISVNDQKVLPVFKNYHPGMPTHRLYVKNLAKNVEEQDLHFIFKRYITKTSTELDHEYNVRLMQEGRMKGQAFITLQNVAQAQLALKETNGYILKDKPMVIQFAKVPKS